MLPAAHLLIAVAASIFPHIVEQDAVRLELFPRTPQQMASFYEARGFPRDMIDIIRRQCFITVRIHNRRDSVLWLELAAWELSVDGVSVTRRHRDEWKALWQQMDVPLPSQSTFRWTLLPEVLDYLPDEQESGNIILPATEGEITLTARFATGEDKQGEPIVIRYPGLRCAR